MTGALIGTLRLIGIGTKVTNYLPLVEKQHHAARQALSWILDIAQHHH